MSSFFDWFEEFYQIDKEEALRWVIRYYEMSPVEMRSDSLRAIVNSYVIAHSYGDEDTSIRVGQTLLRLNITLCNKYALTVKSDIIPAPSSAEDLINNVSSELQELAPTHGLVLAEGFVHLWKYDPVFFVYKLLGSVLITEDRYWRTPSKTRKAVTIMCEILAWALSQTKLEIRVRPIELKTLISEKEYAAGRRVFDITDTRKSEGHALVKVPQNMRSILFEAQLTKLSNLSAVATFQYPTGGKHCLYYIEAVDVLCKYIANNGEKMDVSHFREILLQADKSGSKTGAMYTVLGVACSAFNTSDPSIKIEALSAALYWLIKTLGYCVLCREKMDLSYCKSTDWTVYRNRGEENFYIYVE